MSVLEFFRQYNLREYFAVFVVAVLGGTGVVTILTFASGGSTSSEPALLLKRETAAAPAASVSYIESAEAAERKAAARAEALAERRRIRAARAARRAAALASRRARVAAARRAAARSTPRSSAPAPTPVVNRPATREPGSEAGPGTGLQARSQEVRIAGRRGRHIRRLRLIWCGVSPRPSVR